MIKELHDAVISDHDAKLKPSLEDNHDTKLEHTKNSNSEETQQKLNDPKIAKNKGNKKQTKTNAVKIKLFFKLYIMCTNYVIYVF